MAITRKTAQNKASAGQATLISGSAVGTVRQTFAADAAVQASHQAMATLTGTMTSVGNPVDAFTVQGSQNSSLQRVAVISTRVVRVSAQARTSFHAQVDVQARAASEAEANSAAESSFEVLP